MRDGDAHEALCSHGDMDEGAVTDDRIEERAAHLTARVVAVFVAKDHEIVLALGDPQLVALDASERLEGRTSRPPADRAVTVRGVDEFVRFAARWPAAASQSSRMARWKLRSMGRSR